MSVFIDVSSLFSRSIPFFEYSRDDQNHKGRIRIEECRYLSVMRGRLKQNHGHPKFYPRRLPLSSYRNIAVPVCRSPDHSPLLGLSILQHRLWQAHPCSHDHQFLFQSGNSSTGIECLEVRDLRQLSRFLSVLAVLRSWFRSCR
jgi:hypothetical protein